MFSLHSHPEWSFPVCGFKSMYMLMIYLYVSEFLIALPKSLFKHLYSECLNSIFNFQSEFFASPLAPSPKFWFIHIPFKLSNNSILLDILTKNLGWILGLPPDSSEANRNPWGNPLDSISKCFQYPVIFSSPLQLPPSPSPHFLFWVIATVYERFLHFCPS